MNNYTYFSSHPKTKLKFNPGVGTDVALPTPNPVTQYLSTKPTEGDVITGKEPENYSTVSVDKYPSASSVLRNTPISSSARNKISMAPIASTKSSEPVVEAGKTKPEMSTLNAGPSGDSRSTLDSRAIAKGSKDIKGKGLLTRNPNKNYFRQVLNAL